MKMNIGKRSISRCLIKVSLAVFLSAGMGAGYSAEINLKIPSDVANSMAVLPDATVVQATSDGVPTFLRGRLARVGEIGALNREATEQRMVAVLGPALAPFRLKAGDLRLRKMNTDERGYHHLRYSQVFRGLDVVGGDLVAHVDANGTIYAINGGARGDLSASLGQRDIGASVALAYVTSDARFAGLSVSTQRLVFFISPEGERFKAYEIIAQGVRGRDPARDKVYVDADSGAIVGVHPQIHFALNRRAYSANNTTSLPGTLRRSEGQAPTGDVDVNAAYDGTGNTYAAYQSFWNRDSYDNAGAALISSVHYSTNYCNAFWDGTQMAYGDGVPAQNCFPLARSTDVTAHELTHAVTERESNLVYSGESGGLNEAMSDIFGAFTEAWVDGGKNGTLSVSADTWNVGEDVISGGLRSMNDPASDGASLDFWTSGAGNVDVHYSSGIANLAFYLMSQGGTHPRGKSSVNVTGIGMDKAIRVFYKANVDILTSTSNFQAARNACVQAAIDLGYTTDEQNSVSNAWLAVNVVASAPPPPDVVLVNGVPVTSLSGTTGQTRFFTLVVPAGATGLKFVLSGGTGDADMYVRFGSKPTTTTYDCRPYVNGNNETCNIATAQAGTYYVMLRAYTTYSNTTLTGTYTTGGGGNGDPYLTNGTPVTGISGASGSNKYWRIAPGAGRTLTIRISGGTGDADLYTRFGSRPTTSTFSCRPYLNGNNETCTITNTVAGDYYIMLRGYTSYSGVTLTGSF